MRGRLGRTGKQEARGRLTRGNKANVRGVTSQSTGGPAPPPVHAVDHPAAAEAEKWG